jgi:hypothetical protein
VSQTRDALEMRRGALRTERASWFPHWQELSRYVQPRSGRFFSQDRNKGEKRHNSIYDETATRALRVLGAGLMAGMTSPARPWFRLDVEDDALREYAPVKAWLDEVTKRQRNIFARSNTYRALQSVYEELGVFGTAADVMAFDFSDVVRHHALTAGEYMVSTNARGEVDTLYREFEMTIKQMRDQFGEENLSPSVKSAWNDGKGAYLWVPVVHAIEPREQYSPGKKGSRNMPFASCYYEQGTNEDKFLSESGYKRFPAVCPRWWTSGGDMYGTSPAMEALGSIKQLQHQQMRKGQAIDIGAKPPLQAPGSMKTSMIDFLPGGVTYIEGLGDKGRVSRLYDMQLDLADLREDIVDVRGRINSAFYVDLFLMLAQDDRSGVTAREIAERHEEKLLMLGPVLERLHNELLSPLIDNSFDAMLEAGLVPEPPPELHGQDLKVEFISMLAQAQRSVGTQSVDRLLGTVGSMAVMQANAGRSPDALDKLDMDQIVDAYADMLGVDSNLIVADDRVALIRDERVKQQQQAQQAATMQQAASTAKDLSAADTSGKNALTDAMSSLSGYSVPGVL